MDDTALLYDRGGAWRRMRSANDDDNSNNPETTHKDIVRNLHWTSGLLLQAGDFAIVEEWVGRHWAFGLLNSGRRAGGGGVVVGRDGRRRGGCSSEGVVAGKGGREHRARDVGGGWEIQQQANGRAVSAWAHAQEWSVSFVVWHSVYQFTTSVQQQQEWVDGCWLWPNVKQEVVIPAGAAASAKKAIEDGKLLAPSHPVRFVVYLGGPPCRSYSPRLLAVR